MGSYIGSKFIAPGKAQSILLCVDDNYKFSLTWPTDLLGEKYFFLISSSSVRLLIGKISQCSQLLPIKHVKKKHILCSQPQGYWTGFYKIPTLR